jgi:IS5 family transposase
VRADAADSEERNDPKAAARACSSHPVRCLRSARSRASGSCAARCAARFGSLRGDCPYIPRSSQSFHMAAPSGSTSLRDEILADRKKYIGYNVAVNYAKDPIVVMRGEKQFLYDEVRVRGALCVLCAV